MSVFLLLHLTGFALLCDLRCGKIPNALIVTGLLCAPVRPALQLLGPLRSSFGYAPGFPGMLAGMVLPFVTIGLLLLFRAIGAGDVKLLAVIGGFLGPGACARVIVAAIFAGGLISLILIRLRGNALSRAACLRAYVRSCLSQGRVLPYRPAVTADATFCFSIPIAAALAAELCGVLSRCL